jgi:hypothetical protein
MSANLFCRTKLLTGAALAALLWTAGCTTDNKPKPPQPGSPEFSWKAAQGAYKQGDYEKAANLLSTLAQKESEFSAKAAPMALILTHGATHAYLELAEKYGAGAKRTRGSSAAFYRLVSEYRSKASATGLRYAEITSKFTASLKDADITLAYDPPNVEDADPPQYKRIESGQMIPAAEITAVESQVLARWTLLSTANAVGARGKAVKAKEAFSGGEAKIPQAVFLPALAFSLFETAEMFGPKKLNQPNRVILALCSEAEKIIGKVKPSKETGELLKKIKAVQKKAASAS